VNTISELALLWMISYLLHSSILLSITYLIDRLGFLKNINNAEMVWRFAVLAGLLTASLQTQYYVKNSEKIEIASTLTIASKVNTQVKDTSVKMDKLKIQSELKMLNETSIVLKQNELNPKEENFNQNIDSLTSFYSIPSISIPQKVMSLSAYIVGVWLFIAFVLWIKTIYGIRTLNRVTQSLPILEKVEFENYLKQYKNHIFQLRLSDRWMSPLVAPNSFICIPSWVFEKLSPEQRIAMLAHEAAHVVRRDPIWRIAMQLYKALFFFQPLNIVAQRQLTLLSELACDQVAMRASSQHQLVHSLYACAKIVKNHAISPLALAMASPSSLYVRISTLLNEGNMKNYFVPKSSSSVIGKLLLVSCTLSLTVFAMPSIVINANNTEVNSISSTSKTSEIFDNKSVNSEITQKPNENLQTTVAQSDLPDESPKDVNNQKFIEPVVSTNLLSNESNSIAKINAQNGSSQENQSTASLTINQAKQYFDTKEYAKALAILNFLVRENDVEAQVMLGEMTWYGEGVESSQPIAVSLFKKAASSGNVKAQKFLELFAERENRQAEIKYYMTEFDGGDYKFNAKECPQIDFNQAVYNRYMASEKLDQYDKWVNCFNLQTGKISTLQNMRSVIPLSLLNIMTSKELDKAKQHLSKVFFENYSQAKSIALNMNDQLKKWDIDTTEKINRSERQRYYLDDNLKFTFKGNRGESFNVDSVGVRGGDVIKSDTIIPNKK
jgi:beta-lactamase regulating signal transducer with metallopeptidase domain